MRRFTLQGRARRERRRAPMSGRLLAGVGQLQHQIVPPCQADERDSDRQSERAAGVLLDPTK